ncbi:hypothetical protein EDD86DRAFT_244358 [Gorgonomyces haynaldii]|nr:hypothetical protein EDD86DRAFT_244358 [Gorgonomyces haynaldii]
MYPIPQFNSPWDYFALFLIIIVMLAYLVCMVRLWPALRQNKFYAKALYVAFIACLVWNIFKLIYVYSDSPPWVNWAYSSLGLISQSLAVLIDGEILKAFCAISKVVTPKMVTRLQYCLLALHVTLAGSTYVRVFYIGNHFPNWLILWFRFGYAIFVILQQLLELWQANTLTVDSDDLLACCHSPKTTQ